MVWTGSSQYRLAPALATLLDQLEKAYPGSGWVNSPQTGTIGDAAHFPEGSASDHNPWLDDTVRALDIAANASGVAGIVTVTDAPDCEALFAMVNQMYADRDPRVFPNGYAIYKYRITDWDNPGGVHAQQGDPHLYHLHISVSQNPVGFNSTAPWPLPGESTSSATATQIGDDMSAADVAAINKHIDAAMQAQQAWITAKIGGTIDRAFADHPVTQSLATLPKLLRDTACALGGQMTKLPDGTVVSSIGATHKVQMDEMAKLQQSLTDVADKVEQIASQPQAGPVSIDEAKLAADLSTAVRAELDKLSLTIGVKA